MQMILFTTTCTITVSSFTVVSSWWRATTRTRNPPPPQCFFKRSKFHSYYCPHQQHHNYAYGSSSGGAGAFTRTRVLLKQTLPHRTIPSSSSDEDFFSFDEMSKLDQRLEILEEEAPGFLFDYYEPRYCSFSIAPGKTEKLSITSTAYALRALLEYPQDGDIVEHSLPPPKDIIKALLQSDWRSNDLYAVSLIVLVILRMDPNLELLVDGCKDKGEEEEEDDGLLRTFMKMVMLVLSGRPQRRRGEQQLFSTYISYLCCSVYVDLKAATRRNSETGQLQLGMLVPQEHHFTDLQNQYFENSTQSQQNDSGGAIIVVKDDGNKDAADITTSVNASITSNPASTFWKELTISISRTAEISYNELCRQLAYHTAGSSSFDVIKIVYSLLSYIKSCNSLRGTAGRELIVDAGQEQENQQNRTQSNHNEKEKEEIIKMNPKLVSAALRVFFQQQDPTTGLWERGQPIYKSFKRKGRNVGNAYVFGLDALGSLLEALPPEDFRPYLMNLQLTLAWIELNRDVEVIADYCDPDTGECSGKTLRGWTSPNLSPPVGPKAWSTAQTITCLIRMRKIVRQLLHNDVLDEFKGKKQKNGPNDDAWNRLLDSDLGEPGSSNYRTIKQVLEQRVILPFANSVSSPSVGAAYSTIIFGSPGTAKTTITEAVAEKMGWDFVVIDTAAFLADGLTNVASRIRYIFTHLQALRNCVILFDEVEEFCLDREAPGTSMESRMLTTAMLTAINDLRRTKQSIFFLATNRLRAFDAAIIRPGRFDMQLFVGTPNLNARLILLEQALNKVPNVSQEDRAKAMDTYGQFLQSQWSKDCDVMFMNYLEGKQFASSVASIVTSGRELERDELERILSQQAAVMTARGSVREEYIAQMELSRL